MKQILKKALLILLLTTMIGSAFSQGIPELMYYQFDAGGPQSNTASAPVGTSPNAIVGTTLSIGSPAMSTSALVGTAGSSTTNYLPTGWNTNLGTIEWTIGFWMNNIPSSTTLYYLFGDAGNSFRFFVNGAPGAGNCRLTGTGWPTVNVTGVTGAANYLHFVRTLVPNEIKAYKNGVFQATFAVTGTPTVGTGFRLGGYSANTGLNGQFDEFRLYNRALSATEIASTWNVVLNASPCIDPPTAGTASASATNICLGGSSTLSLTGGTIGTGQTYLWEESATSGGPYTTTGTTAAITVNPSVTTYYRCTVTCGTGTSISNEISVTIPPPFPGGFYTIDKTLSTGGGNFASFADAVSAMSCGISGPVIFDVAAGTGPYTEQVTIPQIGGASLTNTITFIGNNETLTFNATLAAAPHTLALNGADFIRVNDLNIIGTGPTYALVGHLWNNADNNKFTNCTFTAPANGTLTTHSPFSCSGSETAAVTSGVSGSNNELVNCTTNNGYYGIAFAGNSAGPNTGNKIINCNLRDAYFYTSYNIYQKYN
jgi:hypothetical protein